MKNQPQKASRDGVIDLPGPTQAALCIQPLAQRSMFWRPLHLASSAWLEHIPFAFWLTEAHQPQLIVELGTGPGASYFAFCQAVEKLGLDARCFAVDHWDDPPGGAGDASVFEQVKACNDAHYSAFSRLLRSSFDDALPCFSDGSIDLLHIDGEHAFEAVRHDFEAWLPKLSERAIVLLHASNVRERQVGVYRLFEQLQRAYPTFEFIHGDGLAVLGVGPKQNDLLQGLFKANKSGAAKRVIHEVFSRLGRGCADSFAATLQRAAARPAQPDDTALQQLEREIGTLREEKRALAQSNEQRFQELAQLTRLLEEREAGLREKDARLAESDSVRARKREALNRLETELQMKAASLQVLEKELVEARARADAGQTQDAALARLAAENAALRGEQAKAAGKLDDAAREIAALNRRLAEREAGLRMKEKEAAAQQQHAERLGAELGAKTEALRGAEKRLAEALAHAETLQKQKDSALALLEADNRKLRSEQQILTKKLEERFNELATLTRLLDEQPAREAAVPEPKNAAPGLLTVPLRDLVDTFALPKGIKSQIAAIEASGLFDRDWYLRQYPDIAKSGANPIKHYIRFGAAEGRNPGPGFNTSAYLAKHPEIVREGINPLVHYIQNQKKP